MNLGQFWAKNVKNAKIGAQNFNFFGRHFRSYGRKKRDFGTFAKNFPGYPSRILSPKLKSQKHRGGTSKMSFFEKCKNRTKSQKHRGGTSKMSFSKNL